MYCMDVGMEPRSKICKASILYHRATSLYQHAQSKLPSLLLFSLPPFSTQHLVATKGPYLSVFLIRMALKMCSKGDFSCLGVGCRKGCRATSENPCWYSSRSWAGKSFREVSLTAEECGSSARVERGEIYQDKSNLHDGRHPKFYLCLQGNLFDQTSFILQSCPFPNSLQSCETQRS